MRPLVGIPLCLDERGRWKPAREYQYIDTAYVRAVSAAGANAVFLPLQESAEELVARIDGLLLPGGDDLPPPHNRPGIDFDLAPERQIDFDSRLLAHASSRGIPILGICYGMQLLALHRGGRLVYDIPSDCPQADSHQLPETDGRHRIQVEAGSRLAAALGGEAGPVNSLHHQGVSDPGKGMRVSARAVDGLIEAIESREGPFCLGVQWHPEKLDGPHREGLFGAFAAACSARATGKRGLE
jgi:putative glutamine amidotransferase